MRTQYLKKMNNTYLSETFVKIPGIRKPKQLAKRIEGKGYLQTTSPDLTPKNQYEFFPYRVVCYHPIAEQIVKKFLEKDDLNFTVLHE